MESDQPLLPPASAIDANGRVTVMVELHDAPALSQSSTSSANRRTIRLAAQNALIPQLERAGGSVLFQTQLAFNGVAISIPAAQASALRHLPGVASVQVIAPKAQVADQAILADALDVAANAPVAPGGATGLGTRIGIIDSGIDYTHADFGGAGTSGAYTANDRTVVEPGSFPTTKVDGYDFAGDSYDASGAAGSTAPQPDADPLDCNGRGTHLAGTAAGFGVNANGSTYTGPYTPGANISSLKVPPGTAPEARLYALKIFGCAAGATTTLTTQALEWALDPNRDGSTADHLDVVVLALSTPFGGNDDPDAVAVNNAVQAGMIVVAAAGNGGNTFYSIASPASASGAIAVGASIGSRNPLLTNNIEPAAAECDNSADLAGVMLADNRGQVTNRSSECAYDVALASYRKFDDDIDNQQIFSYATARVEPGQTVTLEVDLPDCAAQVDLVRGPVLLSLEGQRYGIRLLAFRQIGGKAFCARAAAPVYGLAPNTARGGQRGNNAVKPDVVAPSINVPSAEIASGSSARLQSQTWAGMPRVAGAVALLRQLHPTWSTLQIKAAIMNSATAVLLDSGEPYPPSLAGAGQINIESAAAIDMLAFGVETLGSTALNYGAPWASTAWSANRTLRLENVGSTAKTVTLGQTLAAREQGVSLSVPAGSIAVAPGSFVDVVLPMNVDPNALNFTPDEATATRQNGYLRHYLAEHSGYIQVELGAGSATHTLRVPFQVAPKAAAASQAAGALLLLPPSATSFSVALANTGARNSDVLGTASAARVPLVSAFELAESSAAIAGLGPSLQAADVRYLGVSSDYAASLDVANSVLFFGIASYGPWSTPNEVRFELFLDTNLDGVEDYVVLNTSRRVNTADPQNDVFVSPLYRILADGTRVPAIGFSSWNTLQAPLSAPYLDGAPYNTSVLVQAVGLRFLELAPGQTQIRYRLETRARDADDFGQVIDQVPATGWKEYDIPRPAVAPLNDASVLSRRPMFFDTTSTAIIGAVNSDVLTARGSARLLLLHHHNAPGSQAELVEVRSGFPGILAPLPLQTNAVYLPLTVTP